MPVTVTLVPTGPLVGVKLVMTGTGWFRYVTTALARMTASRSRSPSPSTSPSPMLSVKPLPSPHTLAAPNAPVLLPVASPPFRLTVTAPPVLLLSVTRSRSPSPSTSPSSGWVAATLRLTPLLNVPLLALVPVASPPFRRMFTVRKLPVTISRSRSPSTSARVTLEV